MNVTDHPRRIIVAGAGLAGALLATQLGRKGHEVILLERRGDPRTPEGAARGRSINLAISVRGLHALKTIGLDEAVLAEGVRMPGRMIHGLGGANDREPIFQPYSADPTRAINSVSRGGLNALLLNAAEQEATVTIHFKRRLVEIDWTTDPARPAAIAIDDATGRTERFEGDLVVASDGAYSAARTAMQKTEGFDYSQTYLSHGYKELTIPPKADGSWAMEPEALHIWPRGGYMMIALPNRDRSFTCTLFLAHHRGRGGDESFEAIPDEEAATAFFVRHFPDAAPLMPDFRREFKENPIGSMVTIRCRPWHRGRIALLGDAAHAIVPFYGQGANCAFEDCVAMVEALHRHPNDLDAAIADYERARCDNADAIAELAQINFIEMRDHTASAWFRARKKLEQGLNRLLPKLFLPLSDMVSFSTIPYAAARKRARRQWIVVGTVAALALILIIVAVVAIL